MSAAERVTAYLDLLATRRGLHPELIHTLGDETTDGVSLTVSDLRAILAALSQALPQPVAIYQVKTLHGTWVDGPLEIYERMGFDERRIVYESPAGIGGGSLDAEQMP